MAKLLLLADYDDGFLKDGSDIEMCWYHAVPIYYYCTTYHLARHLRLGHS